MEIAQMFFEFREWEKCFKVWRENVPIYGEEMQLVVSTNSFTSGYWIEAKGKDLTKGDKVYIGSQVDELEKRIRSEIEDAKKKGRSIKFIK